MARDNHTDSLMLGAAAYDDGGQTSVLQKALLVYHDEVVPLAPYDSLIAYASTQSVSNPAAYPRYWHGYLVIVKPLLLVMNYRGIRVFNVVMLTTLWLILLRGIHLKIGKKETVSFLLATMFLFPASIPYCMQYSNMTYIMLIAGIIMVFQGEKLRQKEWLIYYWLFLGIATAYFDFLTYPVLALGIALVLQELIIKVDSWKKSGLATLVWLFGYAGMWSSKWILADLLTEEHVIRDALNQVLHRTVGGSDFEGRHANALSAIAANLSCYTNVLFLLLILVCLIVFFGNMRKTRTVVIDGKGIAKRNFHLLWIALLPFAWYAFTASHSFDHSSYTYRAIMVTVFALLVFACPMTPTVNEERVSEYINE